MFKRTLLAGTLAIVLALAALSPVRAVTSTTPVALSSASFTDLGAGPMYLGAGGGAVVYAFADSQPAASSVGLGAIQPGASIYAGTTSHVWARSIVAGVNAMVSSGTGVAGGGGTVTISPYAYTTLTPGQHNLAITTSTALTIPTGATYATIQAATATVKYTTDGTTTPTASVGMTLNPGSGVVLSGATALANFRAISATGTLDVEYFK